MSLAFPPVLARLIPRLGSMYDGEIVATVRAIERPLRAQKLDWHDVAAAVTAQAPPTQWDYEPQHHESAAASAKQRRCVHNIITEAHRRGVRVDRRAA